MLDAGSAYGSRIALFVIKAGSATGWQSRGFNAQEEMVKDFPLDLAAGPAAHAYQHRVAAAGNIAEMGGGFAQQFGAPSDEQVLVLPLALKDKVAALVYADCGAGGRLDSAALELLVMATSAWLELISLRKHAAPREDVEAGTGSMPAPAFAHSPHLRCKLFLLFPIPSPRMLPRTYRPALRSPSRLRK